MSQEPLPEDFATVRLFPLPNLVLFPHVIQPLHIFEPRYRQLMADALEDDRLVALALLRPGWEEDYHQAPPIHPVVCVGQVYQEERLPDGRYNLLLRGLRRASVLEEVPAGKLYRVARARALKDIPVTCATTEASLRQELGKHLRSWFASQPMTVQQLGQLLQSKLDLGSLCDIFSFALPLELEVKQQLLAEVRVEARTRLLLGHLEDTPAPEAPPHSERRFPPEFSAN